MNFEAPNSQMFLIENAAEHEKAKKNQVELLFEHFNIGGLYFKNNAVLSSFLHSKENAIVVDIGGYNSFVTPVVEGFVHQKCKMKR